MNPVSHTSNGTPTGFLDDVHGIRCRLLSLREAALAIERFSEDEIALVHPDRQVPARNLVDYLAVRQQDLRDLQYSLYERGLSTLAVIHRHVMASIHAQLEILDRLCGEPGRIDDASRYPPLSSSRESLESFADDTLGRTADTGSIRVMVTMPSEAAADPGLIESLMAAGMTLMRVNCAHDGPESWLRMVEHLRAAETKLGKTCRVAFDLAGPKLRTGPIVDGPEVLRFKPERDRSGRSVTPAAVAFGSVGTLDSSDSLTVPLDAHLCAEAQVGDQLHLQDARGRQRVLVVDESQPGTLRCTCDRTIYLTTGTRVELCRDKRRVASGRIGRLPAVKGEISLTRGDSLLVTRALTPGRPAVVGEDETIIEPATIGCSLPEIFGHIEVGHRVLLDDGKFEGVVRAVGTDSFRIEIVRAGRGRAKLLAEKGMNFPDTPLDLPALTVKDVQDLQLVAGLADLVSLSFVHKASDIDELHRHLDRLGAADVGVILKIENRSAFERLPELLMTASKRRRIAVMVARGDLGVEIGFERLAEVQEEMLWLCEAAQVPVIWATQVLESLAKDGLPTRAEVTDAAMSIRAECVMLNKGPHIDTAIRFLCDVARRMTQHADKTFPTHRALSVAASGWLEMDHSSTLRR